jgi:hypothetical protein
VCDIQNKRSVYTMQDLTTSVDDNSASMSNAIDVDNEPCASPDVKTPPREGLVKAFGPEYYPVGVTGKIIKLHRYV